MWPLIDRHKSDRTVTMHDALTVGEFFDYLNGLADVHAESFEDDQTPHFTHGDIASMLRRITKWRP